MDVQLDTNKDEFLSLEELTADSEKEWTEEETEEMKRIDTDQDELYTICSAFQSCTMTKWGRCKSR